MLRTCNEGMGGSIYTRKSRVKPCVQFCNRNKEVAVVQRVGQMFDLVALNGKEILGMFDDYRCLAEKIIRRLYCLIVWSAHL